MMPYGEYAECPNCGKIAHGEEEIEELLVTEIWAMKNHSPVLVQRM